MILSGIGITFFGGLMATFEPTDRPLGLSILATGIPLVVAGVLWLRLRRKVWRIVPHENGAQVEDRTGRRTEILFAELAAVSHNPCPTYANGAYTGTQHALCFWRQEDPPPCPYVRIDCEFGASESEAEAIRALADAARGAVCARLTEIVDSGGMAKSPGGFQVDANSIRYRETRILMAEIARAGIFDGRLCFWRKGEDFPALKLDMSEANVMPIMDLVSARLAEGEAQEGQEPEDGAPAPDLGRVLFERRGRASLGWLLVVLGAPLCLLVVGIPIVLFALRMVTSCFRCHEYGVSYRRAGKEIRLLYSQVSVFTHFTTLIYVNELHMATRLSMDFQTDDPASLPPIKYSTRLKIIDSDLDELCERISAIVARRLLRQFVESGSFEWTKSLTVGTDGLRYRPGRFFGTAEWVHMPFENYRSIDIIAGTFHLYATDAEASVFSCSTSDPNFSPGLHAFLEIAADQAS